MRCEDCATDCQHKGTIIVRDELEPGQEWRYCSIHAPLLDPGVEVADERA